MSKTHSCIYTSEQLALLFRYNEVFNSISGQAGQQPHQFLLLPLPPTAKQRVNQQTGISMKSQHDPAWEYINAHMQFKNLFCFLYHHLKTKMKPHRFYIADNYKKKKTQEKI